MGHTPKIEIQPWRRALEGVKGDQYAGIITTKSAERTQFLYFSNSLSSVVNRFFKKKDRIIEWKTDSDLANYSVGIVNGYNYHKKFMELLSANSFKKVETISGMDPNRRGLLC